MQFRFAVRLELPSRPLQQVDVVSHCLLPWRAAQSWQRLGIPGKSNLLGADEYVRDNREPEVAPE